MADFAALSSTTNYLTLLAAISARDQDLAKALDPAYTSVTTPQTNSVRYSSANKRWETYNGSAWVELIAAATDAFNMTVTGLRGGNIYGAVTNNGSITGGTVNAATLQVGGSNAWTVASLTNLNQLTNGPGYITASALSPYAPLASPALTGAPTAPTAAVDTSTTQLATTQYVVNQTYLKASTAAATYAPLGGGGASGTWGISITGNAATTSQTSWANLQTTNQLNAQGNQASAMATTTGGLGGIMVQGPGAGYGAFMSFHRPGQYASYFGMDADNQWKVGGWSAGANAYVLLHAGNYTSYAPSLTGGGASGTWAINVTGNAGSANTAAACSGNAATATLASKASTLSQGGGNGTAMTFNWVGQGGQPPWVWGGSDGVNHYVYNPSNFSVNYANSAGSAGTAGSCSGNAASASSVAMSAARTDTAAYPVVWGTTGSTSQLYSCTAVNIQSSTGTLNATILAATGRVFGNGTGGNGLGTITVAAGGTPSGGAQGDIYVAY